MNTLSKANLFFVSLASLTASLTATVTATVTAAVTASFASHAAFADDRGWTLSKNYQDVRAFMNGLIERNPTTTKMVTIGVSDSGEVIQGLEIGNGPVHNLVVASHHGNEYGSVEVAKAFAQAISDKPIAGQTVYVVPVLNTWGFDQREREERVGAKSYDPNRNYPGPCGTEGPFTLKSIRAMADFVDTHNVVAAATLHTFMPVVSYPWGISASGSDLQTEYDSIFRGLAQAAVVESKYPTGNSTEMVYAADGTFEDYVFWKHGTWSLLFELGSSHSPSLATVEKMIAVNVPGIRRMLEKAPDERAKSHEFAGHCDVAFRGVDRHDE